MKAAAKATTSGRMTSGQLLGRFWREFASPYYGEMLRLIPVFIVAASASAVYGFIMKFSVDAITAQNIDAIKLIPVGVIIAAVLRAGAIWSQALMCRDLALKTLKDMQRAMFAKLMKADYATFFRHSTGHLVSRFTNDITTISNTLVRSLQVSVRDALTLIGGIGTMLYFDWLLTLLVLGIFALAGKPLAAIAKNARKKQRESQKQIGVLNSILWESITSTRFVKSYNLEDHEKARTQGEFELRHKLAMKMAYNRARSEPLLEVVGGLALAAVFFVAGMRVMAGETTLGDILGMITAMGVATPAARALAAFNTQMNEMVGALERLYELLDEPVAILDAPNAKALQAREGRISFSNVSFSYGDAPAVKDLTFTIEPGQTVALVGPSGAGKSTIFNLLERLYDVAAGDILIDGQNIRGVTMESLRKTMALVSQDPAIFSDTVRNNIALGRLDASDAQIVEAAKAAAAHDFISRMPLGYNTPTGERGGLLSGGEKQRVALARAFLRDAPILLLDEATSALDAESEAKVQEALSRLTKNRTTLVIAHRLATVRNADLILVLDKGAIVERGTHDQLVAREGLYAHLSKLQFQE